MDDRVSKVVKHPAFAPALSSLVSLGVGYAVGRYMHRRAEKGEVIHELPDDLELHVSEDELEKLQQIASNDNGKADVIVIGHDGPLQGNKADSMIIDEPAVKVIEIIETEEVELERRTVFAQNNADWDMEAEMAKRTKTAPYVLHQDEFYNDENGYHQYTYIYYAGDNVMIDEDETPIYNYEERTGPLKFGHGSESETVFHVRNDKRKEEYEINFDPDHYARAIQGLDIEEEVEVKELKHSTHRMRLEE